MRQQSAGRIGHGFIDIAATRHMYRQFATAGIEERHLIADPPDDAEATAAAIRERMGSGSFVHG